MRLCSIVSSQTGRFVIRKVVKIIAIILAISIVCGCGYCGYIMFFSESYGADEIAIAVSQQDNVEYIDNLIAVKPEQEAVTGIIFYPGGNVDAEAYLPLMQKLADEGILCVVVKMPFNMAMLNINGADDVYEHFEYIETWYLMGHSLGGAMASVYAEKNQDKLSGLILLGSYVYGDYPTENSLTIYGTYNSELENSIDYTDNIVIIDGGNHAKFGNYGIQAGDPEGDITAEEQQTQTTAAIMAFIS